MDNLEQAKIGDNIIIEEYYHGRGISVVESITPAGNIKVKDYGVFRPSGRERGGSEWHPKYAYLATQEEIDALRDKWRMDRLRKRILEQMERGVDNYKISQIANILEQEIGV